MKFYDSDGLQAFNVRKPHGRSHKIDGDHGDGETLTVCGETLNSDYVMAGDVTCRRCIDGLRRFMEEV